MDATEFMSAVLLKTTTRDDSPLRFSVSRVFFMKDMV
jgi:hypothetical protein